MKSQTDDEKAEYIHLIDSPLIKEMIKVLKNVSDFKERAKTFYFEVLLSAHRCPLCDGRLKMTGQSECSCNCGNTFDPTTTFQKSACCQAKLIRKTLHYACAGCHKAVPSRFLFDEKLFDKAYFKQMMKESRERTRRKREEIRKLLVESRSDVFNLTENPDFEALPGLFHDLDSFITSFEDGLSVCFGVFREGKSDFNMTDYRDHIISVLTWNAMHFSKIKPLIKDCRTDTVRRFVTLIFMQQDREVDLTQNGNDLLVQKIYHETHN